MYILEPEGNTMTHIRYVTNVLSAHGKNVLSHPLEVIHDCVSCLAKELPCDFQQSFKDHMFSCFYSN